MIIINIKRKNFKQDRPNNTHYGIITTAYINCI